MATKLKSEVTRETESFVMDKGERKLIVTLKANHIEVRCKGLKDTAVWSYAHLYTLGVIQGRMRK
jgi:hypothetical protein